MASTSPHVQIHDVRLFATPSLQLVPQLTKYQEQPQLLDGSLEGIVQPLAVLLRQAAVSSTAQDTARVQGVCRMLHVLVSVRGYKTVVRFFPHEAADLERVLLVGSGPCDGIWQCCALQTSVLEVTNTAILAMQQQRGQAVAAGTHCVTAGIGNAAL